MPLDLPDWATDELLEEWIYNLECRISDTIWNLERRAITSEAREMIRERAKLAHILVTPSKQKPPQRTVGE